MENQWKALLTKTTVKDLVQHKKRSIIFLESSTTLRESLKILADNNILGAPVKDQSSGGVLGFVDVLDIAGYICDESKQLGLMLVEDVQRERFFDVQIVNLINFSNIDFPISIKDSSSILQVLDVFCNPKVLSRLHRVAVLDAQGNFYQVLTQFDLIRWLNENKTVLPQAKTPIGELVELRSPVMVRLDEPLVGALEVLYRNRVSGIALVDESGHISGNLSASDFRGITPTSFDRFAASTLQFLVKDSKSPLLPPITCNVNTPLSDVLEQLTSLHIHRIYIIDEQHNVHPIGLISLGDIICLLKR